MEYLDIVDEMGIPTGEIIERSTAHSDGILHRTSHVWILRNKNKRLQVLLQKRASHKDSFPGCYDISSAGHIPAGFDYKESAIRELEEELGVKTKEDQLVECGVRRIRNIQEFYGNMFNDNQVSKVFYLLLDQDDFTLQESEVDGVLWIDFEQCIHNVSHNLFKHCIVLDELNMVLSKYKQVHLEK